MTFSGTNASPLLVLSPIVLAGLAGSWLARRFRLPGELGCIAMGLLIGPMALDIFDDFDFTAAFEPISQFAMAILAASVGGRLAWSRFDGIRMRALIIAVCESFAAGLAVAMGSLWCGMNWYGAFALGSVASCTSPATTITLAKELRARGPLIRTLLAVAAMDLAVCLVLFAFVSESMTHAASDAKNPMGAAWPALRSILQMGAAGLLGVAMGAVADRMLRRARPYAFSVIFVALMLGVSASLWQSMHFLLTSLVFGMWLANASPESARRVDALEPVEPLLYVFLFTAAAASLHLESIRAAGLLCAAYFSARLLAKYLGTRFGCRLAGTPRPQTRNIALGMIPQAGVAAGLVLLLEGDPAVPQNTAELVGCVVLAVFVVNELIGRLAARHAIRRSGEAGRARPRLMDFLREDYILTDLHAKDKWDALRQLSDFYCRTHRVPQKQYDEMYASVEEREKIISTAMGRGVAIPNGRIKSGKLVGGVLGISREGVDFGAPDGEPARAVLLVITPPGTEQRHLEIMAAFAGMVRNDILRTRLVAAMNPYDAWEVIEAQEGSAYSHFLEAEE